MSDPTARLHTVAVYCGSSYGNNPAFTAAATELGNLFLKRNISLVYGGGSKGTMGVIARTIHQGGGKVQGIIPEFFVEITKPLIGETVIVEDMHTRKKMMSISPKLSGDSLVLLMLFRFGNLMADVGENLGVATRHTTLHRLFSLGPQGGEFVGSEGSVEDTTIAGVPVRIYRPKAKSDRTRNDARPCFIYFHGGGLVLLSAKSELSNVLCSKISAPTGAVVISVDYRLAPEHLFPAQFQDCYAVVSTVIEESTKFGIIKNKIVIGGDSAGGLLSAAISLQFAKEKRGKDIAAQIMINPWLQLIDMTCLPSYQDYSEGFLLNREDVAYYASLVITGKPDLEQEYLSGNVSWYFMQTPYWKFLENQIPKSSSCKIPLEKTIENFPAQFIKTVVDPRLSPLLADTLEGLPATFMVIAEYDNLASEGILFAHRLEKAGVSVIYKIYKSYHGFIHNINPYTTTPVAAQAMQDMINYLNSVFYET